ncbi:MAG: hypothetical protein AAGE96_21805 [Cyanobacteria bacterium P01_G01_bin.19]
MTTNSQKQQISITVDTKLLQEIDKLTKNRSAAVEEGLKLWRKHQVESQLLEFYQNCSESDESFEQEWTDDTQEQAISAWSESEK